MLGGLASFPYLCIVKPIKRTIMERMRQLWDRLWDFVEEAFERLGTDKVDASYWGINIIIDYGDSGPLGTIERRDGTFCLTTEDGNFTCKLDDVDHITLLQICDWLDEIVDDHEDKLERQEKGKEREGR